MILIWLKIMKSWNHEFPPHVSTAFSVLYFFLLCNWQGVAHDDVTYEVTFGEKCVRSQLEKDDITNSTPWVLFMSNVCLPTSFIARKLYINTNALTVLLRVTSLQDSILATKVKWRWKYKKDQGQFGALWTSLPSQLGVYTYMVKL